MLGELCLCVGQHDLSVVSSGLDSSHQITHNAIVAWRFVDLAPSTHDPGVVGGNDCYLVDTLGLDLLDLLDIRRQVISLATGSECTWYADECDALALPLLAGIELLRATTGGSITISDGCPSGCVSIDA